MPALTPKLNLPHITKVTLRRFSLFTANPDPEFVCGKGVMRLVGANGIGKSTLLTAINFCLTGIIPDPNRTFESMEEYCLVHPVLFLELFSWSHHRHR